MRKFAICLIALVFVTLTSATVFAGKQPDIAFHPELYKYKIISGKVTSISPQTIEIEGYDNVAVYNQETKFFRGDDTTAIEKVYGGKVFKDCEKITSSEVNKGDNIKARYTEVGENAVHLEVCLVVVNE